MEPRLLLAIVAVFGALPAAAASQVCAGFASFARGPFQVLGGASFSNAGRSFVGGLGYGGAGPFAQASVGTSSSDNPEGSSLQFGAGAGYQVPLDKKRRVQACPTASLGFASQNDVDVYGNGAFVIDWRQRVVTFGVALGAEVWEGVIPSAAVGLVGATVRFTDQVLATTESQFDSFGLLDLGIGFVVDQMLTFRPGVAIPFAVEGASTVFGLSVGVTLGRKPR